MRSLFAFILLGFSFLGYSQIINFPDANFKNVLVKTKCVDTNNEGTPDADADLNNDGEIDMSEASKIKNLIVFDRNISSLEGIQYFKGLEQLNCSTNKLTSLNVQNLTKLESLYCNRNQLLELDVKNLSNLKSLQCLENQLTHLDIQNLIKLESLGVSFNKLSNLDVQNLTNLKILWCAFNNLTKLDVLNLTSLEQLSCNSNRLTELKVQNLTDLTSLDCRFNQLTKIEVQNLTKLEFLSVTSNKLNMIEVQNLNNLKLLLCSSNNITKLPIQFLSSLEYLACSNNQLTQLDLQNLNNLIHFSCSNNNLSNLFLKNTKIHLGSISFDNIPNLKYICCADNQLSLIQNKLEEYGMTQCQVNTYCSFTPGGKYYHLKGVKTYDGNNSGCTMQEIKQTYLKYQISQNNNFLGIFITNSSGTYSIFLKEGTHTITPTIEYPDHFEVTPSSLTVTFPSTSDTITQNFCITPKGIIRQTNITVIPLSPPARPGFDASYKIVWENVGNQIESGTLNFTYDETLLDYISATQTADQVADGIIKWNFSNLLPFEKREITVTLKVNRPTDTPAVNAGDKLYLTASILDNIFTLENTVVGSYDPNDKTCLQGDRVKPDMVGKYVNYLIRFENTGNYAAENVVIKDIIDTKTFDVSSLQITDASHEVYTRIEGNKVEFIFENIQLPFDDANNDGYVAFKIKTLPTLVLGDSLKNLADIYFDYNFPIRTNEAQTTIALPSFTKDIATEVNVYPNPVRDILYLESDENWSKAEIFDISGRILRSVSLFNQSIDVNGLESGTYFMRLKDEEKVGVVKFVKM